MMAVVSPTSVAAPWRLDDTAMAMIMGTGLIRSRLAMAMATGAIISTVATLSTNAEISPANRARATTAHFTLGTWASRISAILAGILEAINRETMPMVPKIIIMTFHLM